MKMAVGIFSPKISRKKKIVTKILKSREAQALLPCSDSPAPMRILLVYFHTGDIIIRDAIRYLKML